MAAGVDEVAWENDIDGLLGSWTRLGGSIVSVVNVRFGGREIFGVVDDPITVEVRVM